MTTSCGTPEPGCYLLFDNFWLSTVPTASIFIKDSSIGPLGAHCDQPIPRQKTTWTTAGKPSNQTLHMEKKAGGGGRKHRPSNQKLHRNMLHYTAHAGNIIKKRWIQKVFCIWKVFLHESPFQANSSRQYQEYKYGLFFQCLYLELFSFNCLVLLYVQQGFLQPELVTQALEKLLSS